MKTHTSVETLANEIHRMYGLPSDWDLPGDIAEILIIFEDSIRADEEELINKIKVWVVMYRGNGYGVFLNKDIAEEFGEFIAIRNEEKFSNSRDYGKYTPHLYEYGLMDAIKSSKEGIFQLSQPTERKDDDK